MNRYDATLPGLSIHSAFRFSHRLYDFARKSAIFQNLRLVGTRTILLAVRCYLVYTYDFLEGQKLFQMYSRVCKFRFLHNSERSFPIGTCRHGCCRICCNIFVVVVVTTRVTFFFFYIVYLLNCIFFLYSKMFFVLV